MDQRCRPLMHDGQVTRVGNLWDLCVSIPGSSSFQVRYPRVAFQAYMYRKRHFHREREIPCVSGKSHKFIVQQAISLDGLAEIVVYVDNQHR